MARLATIEDVEARMGRNVVEQSERERLLALLDDASAAIRVHLGRTFEVTPTVVTVYGHDGEVTLPADVTGIVSIANVDGLLDAGGWTWDGARHLTLSTVDNLPLFVTLTRAAGSTQARQVVRAVASQMAARAYGRPADQTAVTQESIAGYSYSVGAAAAAGGIGMLPDERATLDKLKRPNVGVIWMTPR